MTATTPVPAAGSALGGVSEGPGQDGVSEAAKVLPPSPMAAFAGGTIVHRTKGGAGAGRRHTDTPNPAKARRFARSALLLLAPDPEGAAIMLGIAAENDPRFRPAAEALKAGEVGRVRGLVEGVDG